ncbi:ABC transporter permease [Acuticoccus sp.]|uniref:ABC transporter permease n=1 Tax=Acuticoccus sp. TaxID=1904378 RepID=UPI003B527516
MASIAASLTSTARVVYSVAQRDTQSKHAESPIGLFAMVLEPFAMMCVMSVVFATIKMRVPGMGDYLMLFIMTGTLPLSMFRGGVSSAERAARKMKRALVLPQIQPIDLVMGGILANFLAVLALYLVITAMFHFFYGTDEPEALLLSIVPAVCNACIALGFACLNMVIKTWFKFWGFIFAMATAPLNICSGMFYTAESLPPKIQEVLWWNPFLHSTELTRTYYFPEFESGFFSPSYYFAWVIGAPLVGLTLERMFRYRLLRSKT